jgi:hypothetical protein
MRSEEAFQRISAGPSIIIEWQVSSPLYKHLLILQQPASGGSSKKGLHPIWIIAGPHSGNTQVFLSLKKRNKHMPGMTCQWHQDQQQECLKHPVA